MKKTIALLLALVMVLPLCACGAEKAPEPTEAPIPETSEVIPDTENLPQETEAQKPTATELQLNETIQLDFVEITFEECGMDADIRQSIKTDFVTRTTGPQPEDGIQFIYLRGTIKNLSKEDLPVFDFFLGEFDIDGYKYACSANECDILTNNGELVQHIQPLTSYPFTMYAKIPNELANNHNSVAFRFGFYDLFANDTLARNRAFEKDPISLCPYQYALPTLK